MNEICNTKHIYRHIRKRGEKYKIVKNNKSYGSFTKIENALLERDLLEDYNWNTNALINIETITKNRYHEMELPPFKKTLKKQLPKYIRKRGNTYTLQKSINGETVYFGTYKTIEEATQMKKNLEKHSWNKKFFKKIKHPTKHLNATFSDTNNK